MHTPGSSSDGNALSESEMRQVLARAGELDAASKFVMTEAELEFVADEAGISRAALQQALREMRESPRPEPVAELAALPHRRGRGLMVSAVLGGLLGLGTNLFETAYQFIARPALAPVIFFTVMIGRSLQLALTHPEHESKLDLQAQLAALWAAYAGGYVLTGGEGGLEAVPYIFGYWLIAAVVAAAIAGLRTWFARSTASSKGD